MIWASFSSRSCFCWLYRASPSLTAKNIINLISVLTIWWCPCVESSLVFLEEGVCYDECILFALISHASKVILKIIQTTLQQYVNRELPDAQAGFRKGRGTRDQIANICWIMEKARVPEKHLFLLSWLCQSLWLCGSPQTVENALRDGNTRPLDQPLEKPICRSGSNS